MNCVSCDICVYHLGLFVFSPGVSLSSRVIGACPVTTDLIMRVNVRTTTYRGIYTTIVLYFSLCASCDTCAIVCVFFLGYSSAPE